MKKIKELIELLGERPYPVQSGPLALEAKEMFEAASVGEFPPSPLSPAQRKVKHHLKYSLISSIGALPAVDAVCPPARPEANLFIWRIITVCQDAQLLELPQVIVPRLRWAFALAVDHELYQAAFRAAELIAGLLAPDPDATKEYFYYTEQRDHYFRLVEASRKILDFSMHIHLLEQLDAPLRQIIDVHDEAHRELANMRDEFDQAVIWLHLYYLSSSRAILRGEFEQHENLTNRTVDFLSEKGIHNWSIEVMIQIEQLYAYAQAGNYAKGTALVEALLGDPRTKQKSRIVILDRALLLCLRSGRYQEAYEFYRQYNALEGLELFDKFHLETFTIYGGYLHLFALMGLVDDTDDLFSGSFRVQRFLNGFEHANKQKSGRNVHLIIIRVLGQIVNRKTNDDFHDYAAIQKYVQRHLSNDESRRSRWFIKALLHIPEQGYERSFVNHYSKTYHDKLSGLPLEEARQHSHLELVRYEEIWEILMDHLAW